METRHAGIEDRSEAFTRYARRRAGGEVVVDPLRLGKEERRRYVRRTLLEDNRHRVKNRPEGAQAKFDKLGRSACDFFRGTALLYYRDYAGADAHLPVVFCVGDVHPENFGVMPNENGAPFFGVNDFDEAHLAPFSYDVKRGAVGFYLAARANGFKKSARRRIVRCWTEGYLEGLAAFARDDRERWFQYRMDSSPPMIRTLLESVQKDRARFLEKMVDTDKQRFRAGEEIVPYSTHIDTFQKVVTAYRDQVNAALRTDPDRFFRVHDVAIKKESGTASLGLDRYYVLIDGPSEHPTDDVILEFKAERRSALRGLAPPFDRPADEPDADQPAKGVVRAHRVQLAGGDPFYGSAEIDGQSFLVRERSPFKDDIDPDDLDEDDMADYAGICGQVLAQTHARSDEDTGTGEDEAEKRILESVNRRLFVDDVTRFAEAAARRIRKDYKAFRKDHELGAFELFRMPEE